MRAVGFDPGLADTGYAALELARGRPAVLGKGVIRTAAGLALAFTGLSRARGAGRVDGAARRRASG